ncbi:cytochrome ubiquinol oxidase subunit I [Liquorilactobacillus satsumensis]|uniref:Cytochrome bd-type oxidase subunit I n=1 Tax=Liquorilactobacillus satsumensis DSM 16230 = JCM 12392 TaxID=1423801 RepID=A0A0R1V3V6_9LACO|nr:cytochrome ubiquinol oxidase subunit I [Liquorilactobacillus satsumensis]KRM00322.1 cytochrome bd-type oxidase subunit I [Liquorilactobacillus satsumensis DSM 16230 = JCM 12392]MCC7667719.1 cytochrome ubiquinol oxidase subunit I [Liquorilactobacillus satsumensis]MCP9313659.1 cytochrome ubiquinol oxidase subunit I [Liquorilactobacillus satsumensis]MCP9328981.1 cytochrome ubiquinol oxidase subunit I [Liquorilactobacillus satsumensis]MCP9357691.1 cytochrome ubiquinol oxidase subunit I [Liquori
MSIVSLARFQFAMTTIYHFFFVPFSIGLALVVAIMETAYIVTKKKEYLKMTKFWGNIFLLSFAVGVVTGIIQEFQFGMNWSDYSRFVGDIFGAPLALEALLAFFMESTFLGLWIFTWDMVNPKLHAVFIWLVTFASMISALWILAANSFMQHPVGYSIKNGHAVMTDFKALLTNPQLWYEFSHVIAGAIVTGGAVVAGLAAFRLLKKKVESPAFYKKSLKIGLVVTLFGSIAVLTAGDLQMKALVREQPMKFAATEGLYKDTGDPAAWTLIAWANENQHKRIWGVDLPYVLSILAYDKPSGAVQGLNSVNKQLVKKYGARNYYPPVNAVFWSFRIMAGFGTLMLLVSLLGLILARKKKQLLYKQRWMLWVLGLCTFAPFLANTAGWLVTELGRYPWTVYGLFTIKQSVSPNVSVASLLTSNIIYFLLFTGLAITMVSLIVREMRKGPDHDESLSEQEKKDQQVDPFDKGAFE